MLDGLEEPHYPRYNRTNQDHSYTRDPYLYIYVCVCVCVSEKFFCLSKVRKSKYFKINWSTKRFIFLSLKNINL